MSEPIEARAAFLKAAVWHGSLAEAKAILESHPEVAGADIYTAATLGDDAAVRRWLSAAATQAVEKGGPHGWDALTYLCFSKYLRLERSRTPGFVRAATALLDAGASANTGFLEANHEPNPEWESALYGAAGVAHHAELTRLLLERGADPNDGETPYHAPETHDNAALRALVESGKLNADSLATMLLRKSDWHDYDGIQYLLENGADPNRMTVWRYTALHQAVRRDNHVAIVKLYLDAGGDPSIENGQDGRSVFSIAARRGRRDVLDLFARRGIAVPLRGVEALIAACAPDDDEAVRAMRTQEPLLVGQLIEGGGTLLAEFSGNDNADGVRQLLGLGVDVNARYAEGDGYFAIAKDSTALHVAAWRASHATVKMLIAHGAEIAALDQQGRTPLALAVKACVDSYWTHRRSPESVAALLGAGASVEGVGYPCGYEEVDAMLRAALRADGR